MELISFILFVISMITASALVSGSEAALLSISLAKVKEINSSKKSNSTKKLLAIKLNLQKYITSIVILNNIINIIGSIYVGILATQFFGEAYIGIFSGILTFLIILFSEIVPKIYGERFASQISQIIAIPLFYITLFLTPLVMIMEKLTSIFVRDGKKNQISEGEIKEMAVIGKQEGSVTSYESDVIENVFKMNDTPVYDIMTPKNKVYFVRKSTKFEEILKMVSETGFTRFPVLSSEGVAIGLINTKDLFKFFGKEQNFKVSKILRPAIFAPETMKVSTLEEKLKKQRIHMAIIVNEHGDFTGIVTLEDVIEEILGEIEDEFDNEEEDEIKQITANKYHIDAGIDLDELNEELNLSLDINENYSTLNGLIISKLDGIPKINDTLKIEEGTFRIIKRTKRKVTLVEFKFNRE